MSFNRLSRIQLFAGVTLAAVVAGCNGTITDGIPGGGGGGGTPTAARVNITGDPSTTLRTQVITPPVRVVIADSNFVAVTTSTAPVTVSLIDTTGAVLSGTLTRNAVAGTALLTDLSVDKAGTYRLLATSPGLISDTSASFVIGIPVADTVVVDLGSIAADTTDQVIFSSERNLSANPAVDTVAVGGTVRWKWLGVLSHGVVFDDLTYTSGNFTAPKQIDLTMPTAGSYGYTCSVHGNQMSGTLVVQ